MSDDAHAPTDVAPTAASPAPEDIGPQEPRRMKSMENVARTLRHYTIILVAASLTLGLWVAHQALTQAVSPAITLPAR
jgi:hypothetical protein